MADEPIIYLAFDNPAVEVPGSVDLLACRHCRNKTYRIEVHEECAGRLYCAACGSYIGKMGWIPEGD